MAIALVIERAHRGGCKVGICGQAPSDHPELARFLVDCGIDSISLNPDSVLDVIARLAGGRGAVAKRARRARSREFTRRSCPIRSLGAERKGGGGQGGAG